MTDNKNYKSLGYYKVNADDLNKVCSNYLEQKVWPLTIADIKIKANEFIFDLQKTIAFLGSIDEREEAMRYIEYFCFSLIVRIVSIDMIRIRSSRATPGTDEMIITDANDYLRCIELTELTHPKNVVYSTNMEVRYVEIPKKEVGKVRVLGISNIIDRVLQLQFLILLDPIIDCGLLPHFYGFRKGRSALQAVSYLSRSIQLSDTNRFVLLSIDIEKCFDNISHEYICSNFPFPTKHSKLLLRWIKCIHVFDNGKRQLTQSGIPQGSILGPIVCNFVLSSILKGLFSNQYPKHPKVTNLRGNTRGLQVTRYILGYADDLMIKVINVEEAMMAKKDVQNLLATVGLKINEGKTKIYDMRTKQKFVWLGYTFLTFPKTELKMTKLINKLQRYFRGIDKNYQTVVLNYVSDENFRSIKNLLKECIRQLKNKPLITVMKEVNSILRGFAGYYNFAANGIRLSYLRSFVDRCFWRNLVEKYRYQGVRRSGWVARTFFLTTISPYGYKWHLHTNYNELDIKRKTPTIWCVDVSKVMRMQPIHINILPSTLRNTSYYLSLEQYNEFKYKISMKRLDKSNLTLYNSLYDKQRGICKYCNLFMHMYDDDQIELHHIYKLSNCDTKKKIKLANRKENLLLLHQSCHKLLHRNEEDAKKRHLLK